jgi:hypothetical protein
MVYEWRSSTEINGGAAPQALPPAEMHLYSYVCLLVRAVNN